MPIMLNLVADGPRNHPAVCDGALLGFYLSRVKEKGCGEAFVGRVVEPRDAVVRAEANGRTLYIGMCLTLRF